ncbi:hypothetical protein KEM55_006017 [Ascosphaera atra]|nr:hypothetical protein KEM55_006017 [Ascosphaera atra]
MPNPSQEERRQAAREVIDILHEMSALLNTNLNRTELSLCVSLIENGVNPEALATIIKELRGDGHGDGVAAEQEDEMMMRM